jgi:hypothetical protein
VLYVIEFKVGERIVLSKEVLDEARRMRLIPRMESADCYSVLTDLYEVSVVCRSHDCTRMRGDEFCTISEIGGRLVRIKQEPSHLVEWELLGKVVVRATYVGSR